jgi:hypothetical protein
VSPPPPCVSRSFTPRAFSASQVVPSPLPVALDQLAMLLGGQTVLDLLADRPSIGRGVPRGENEQALQFPQNDGLVRMTLRSSTKLH